MPVRAIWSSAAGSTIRQYHLNSPYDVSTAVLLYSVSVKPNARDFFIDSTGEHVVLCTNDRVFKYSMSAAWNLNTLSLVADIGLVLDSETVTAEGIWAADDGETIYVLSRQPVSWTRLECLHRHQRHR